MKSRFAPLLLAVLLAGCTSLWMGPGYEQARQGSSSSLVDYLYPDGQIPPGLATQMPHLELPANVGIAFVPSAGREDLTAAEKQGLLQQVAVAFKDREYINSIVTIPDQYLRSARGLVGMQQTASLHGVDIMALVSYDQVTFSTERDSAILYWTIIGAVTVKGNSNEVQTMIDTAVFDVETGKLLFRAPGTHRDQRNTTLMDNESDQRALRSASFVAATGDMITNLDAELTEFRTAVHEGQRAQVEWREGQGGGAIDWPLLLFLAGAGLFRRRR